MFKRLFSFTLFFLVATSSVHSKDIHRSEVLFHQDQTPSKELALLLESFNIEQKASLKDLVSETQKKWFNAKERWQHEVSFENHREAIMPILNQLHCLEELPPQEEKYEYALFLGATVKSMQARLEYLQKLLEEKVTLQEVVFLVGERALEESFEKPFLIDIYGKAAQRAFKEGRLLTEYDAILFMVENSPLNALLSKTRLSYINTPMQPTANGYRRPNTRDTILCWFQMNSPKAGACLAISSQPYVGYQDQVLRNLLPKGFPLETVGKKAADSLAVSVHLDNLAKWIYEYSRSVNVAQ